jgi:hypothetical protein
MLPEQYAIKSIALTVVFFVVPAILDEIIDMLIGMLQAKALIKLIPANFAALCWSSNKYTRRDPKRLRYVSKQRQFIFFFETYLNKQNAAKMIVRDPLI